MYEIKNIVRGKLEYRCEVETKNNQTILRIYYMDGEKYIKIDTLSIEYNDDVKYIESVFIEYTDGIVDICERIKEAVINVNHYSRGNVIGYSILYETNNSFELCTRIYKDDECEEETCDEFDTNGISLSEFYRVNEKILKLLSEKNIFKRYDNLME